MPTRRSAASGEQSAIAGYQAQYLYSACEIFRQMQNGTLRGITLADPNAGIFDDLVLHVVQEIRATQVKSQRDRELVRLWTALRPIIRQIAQSWISLRRGANSSRVVVRYIFPGTFSTSDTALGNRGSDGPKHSAEFARFVRRTDISRQEIETSKWSARLAELERGSELDSDDFVNFLNSLELFDSEELVRNSLDNFPVDARRKIDAIQDLLPRLVARRDKQAFYSETDLIRELNWRRLTQLHAHEFPVPDYFEDNVPTNDALRLALTRHSKGYVSLIGPPGTGKSTLLQMAVQYSPQYNVSRYLAYMPDHRHGLGRAEAASFLNDLISALREHGFGSSRYAIDDLPGLRSAFLKQLDEAGELFRQTGRKTVIIVDGLDHVPREERPETSFLTHLPTPASVPDGVIFLLGSQTLDLADLNIAVRQQAGSDDRKIEIEALPRRAIFAIADRLRLPEFVSREDLYEACGGHPLTAKYYCEALLAATSEEDARQIMSAEAGLGRSLAEMYARVWSGLEGTDAQRGALGLLARAEAHLTPQQISSVYGDAAVESVLKSAGFLLAGVRDHRLGIFHNSFRLFIEDQTRIRFGRPDASVDREFNRLLARIAGEAGAGNAQHWMELRYNSRAGDLTRVLEIGTADYFRQSLAAFRPPSEIYTDIRLTYAAVGNTRSRPRLLRTLLIEKEVGYRIDAVSHLDLVELFVTVGRIDLAVGHALEGAPTGNGWLRLVDVLWERGHLSLARQVLDANEPLDLLFGRSHLSSQADIEAVGSWLARAHRFRPVERLKETVSTLLIDSFHREPELIRKGLLHDLALGVLRDDTRADVHELCVLLGLGPRHERAIHLEMAQHALHVGDFDAARENLRQADLRDGMAGATDYWRTLAAEVASEAGDTEHAVRVLTGVSVPSISSDVHSTASNAIVGIAETVYRRTFLAAALRVGLASEPQSVDSAFFNTFDSKLRQLAILHAEIKQDPSSADLAKLRSLILYFANTRPEPFDTSGYRYYASLEWLAATIANVILDLEETSRGELIATVDELLGDDSTSFAASRAFALSWARSVYARDGDGDSAVSRIERAYSHSEFERTPQEVVERQAAFATALAEVGSASRASDILTALHADTFGYWLAPKKEPQYEFWIWAFEKACEENPLISSERALTLGRFVLGMAETEGRATASRMVPALIAGAGISPEVLGGLWNRLTRSPLSSWAELADGMLAAVATAEPAKALRTLCLYRELVLPFYDGTSHAAMQACLRCTPALQRVEAARLLLNSILVCCPISSRAAALQAVVEAAPAVADEVESILASSENVIGVPLKSYSAHSGSSAANLDQEYNATTLAELARQGERATELGPEYQYSKTARRLAGSSTHSDIQQFLAVRPILSTDAKFLISAAWSMLHRGQLIEARQYFSAAAQAASTGYWLTFYGGEKLELLKLRVAIDGNHGREEGYTAIVADLSAGQAQVNGLLANLDEILTAVALAPEQSEHWRYVGEHLEKYREFSLVEPIAAEMGCRTFDDVLSLVISTAFSLTCSQVTLCARNATMALSEFEESSSVVEGVLKRLQSDAGGVREAASLIYRLRKSLPLRDIVLDQSQSLMLHPDIVVAHQCGLTVRHLGLPVPPMPHVELPGFYALEFPPSEQASNFEPPPGLSPGTRPIWFEDPWSQTSMMAVPFRVTARGSSVSLEMLRRRCGELVRRAGGRDVFGPEVERENELRLSNLGLKFPWRRLLPMAAQRAFGCMLTELISAGAVDPAILELIWEEIGGPTLGEAAFPVEERPPTVSVPNFPSDQYGALDGDAWIAGADDDLVVPIHGHQFVLAERSSFAVRASRSTAELVRVLLPLPADPTKMGDSLYALPRLHGLGRFTPMYDRSDSVVVAYIDQPLFGDVSEPTLTICPYVAHDLGWVRDEREPFTLLDSDGIVAARTIRWIDGTDRFDSYDPEMFGVGNVIFLSASGRKQLSELVRLSMTVAVFRTFTRSQATRTSVKSA